MTRQRLRLGIDLGGTKLEGILLDHGGRQLWRKRRPTPSSRYRSIIDAVVSLVADAESTVGAADSVGIGTPGALCPDRGTLKNSNTTCLNGRPLDKDLADALRRPIRMANDANCLALSEATDGAGARGNVVFAVILGTGVGGGVVVDGTVLTGPNAIAGEWGHNPLPWPDRFERPGPQCYCGRQGCIETFLSGPGLEADFESAAGQQLTAPDIVKQASNGDAAAEAAMKRYEQRLARALASVINILDPDVIVLAGGLSNIDRLYDTVPDIWDEWVFSTSVRTPLLPAMHGDSSGVRGAAWLWDQPDHLSNQAEPRA